MAALQLDNRVSFFFERLFIPGLELSECEIDLVYKEKKTRIKVDIYLNQYPHKEPVVLVVENCFTNDNKIEILILMRETQSRLKKIAKGNINIYKKYFNYTKKYKEEKWVYLDLFNIKGNAENQNTMILQTVASTGKIYMKVALLNPPPEDDPSNKLSDLQTVVTTKTATSVYSQALKNNLKILDKTKENVKANKTEKFRSIHENTNEYLRNLKNRRPGSEEYIIEEIKEAKSEPEPEDGISDVEESHIEGNEEDAHMELGKVNPEVEMMVNKLKEVFNSMGEEIIPKTKEEIKQFIKSVYSQVDGLANAYKVNLNTIVEINKKIKYQAKSYYEKYKEIKENFDKERRELKSKNDVLDYELALNNEENSKLKALYNDVKSELLYFRAKLGVKIENDPPKDEDFLVLSRLLNEVKNEVEIEGLDDQDKTTLNNILNFYNLKEPISNKALSVENGISETKKNEAVNFSDNEDNDNNDDILNNQSHREEINVIISDTVLLYNKMNKLKESVKFNHLKEDEYDFNGVVAKLSVIDNQVLVLDKNYNWISFLEFLSTNFPVVKTNTGSHRKQKSNLSNQKSIGNNTSIQSQLEKIKEEKQKLLNSMNSNSQTVISRSKTPVLSNQKKVSQN